MSERPVGLLIEDIWEAIEKIQRYTSGTPLNRLKKMRRPPMLWFEILK